MADEPKPASDGDDTPDDDAPKVDDPKPARHVPVEDLAAERKKRQELEAKLQEIEDADKSELQKAQDAAAKAQQEAATATARADRLQVALDKGLTPTQAKRLVGDTVEELEADADELLADITPSDDGKKPPAPSKPKADLQSGNDPDDDDDDNVDADALADKILNRGF